MEENKKVESMVNMFENKNILVTGGTGFIASHLVEKLLEKKANIVVPYRSLIPKSYFAYKNLFQQVTLVNADLKEYFRVLEILAKYRINYIFHLAAQPLVETAYYNPLATIKDNILGTSNILEAARNYGLVEGIIIASSDKAYGKSKKVYRETDPLRGNHPYEVSKSSADLITQAYFQTYKLPVAISRLGNVFGPGDTNFNRIIPGIMRAIIKNESLKIRSNGHYKRDYLYIDDVIEGYLKLLKNFNKIKGEAFNFGTTSCISVVSLINKVEKSLKINVKYNILNQAKNEIPIQSLDWQKAKKKLNWWPKSILTEAIKKTYLWYKDYYFNK